jgi:ATP-dependent Clp protease ATP-binding subunit ClpX
MLRWLFSLVSCQLRFVKIDRFEIKDDALNYIVEKALKFKLGARGLRSICEAIINDAMFEIPSQKDIKKLVINKEYAQNKFEKSKFKRLQVA